MNRLADSTSPYLLQHADNPVDWWPWCEEAFQAAIDQDKPIFLSIGYATCHWCHVMAHESFEDQRTAEQMNRDFINIKLDREERPDLDAIYMAALQATQGSGGWPMSVFIDHQKRPFFLATYLPPQQKFNRPSFSMVMSKMTQLWNQERETINKNAAGLLEHLELSNRKAEHGPEGIPNDMLFRLAWTQIHARMDKKHGGLGQRPKFPTTHVYDALMRMASRGIETLEALAFTDFTLARLFDGGIHDHIGGGFHRYSTDAEWLLPHFEKMLYDQALILSTAVQAHQLTGAAHHAAIAHDIVRYLTTDLRNADGAYFSGEDADSEGVEGKFYVFTKAEVIEILGQEDGEFINTTFGFTEEGNYADEADGHRNGTNILHLPHPLEMDDYQAQAAPLLAKLHAEREKRIRPSLDDKVIASWNGFAISALAKAAFALGDQQSPFLQEAKSAADFLLNTMVDENEHLYRSWRQGKLGHRAFLEDEAAVGLGLFDLFQTSGEPRYLDAAILRAETMLEDFIDKDQGAFFQTREDQSDAILRQKEAYDGAEPSGNAIAAELLLRLGHLLHRNDFTLAGEGVLSALAPVVSQMPSGHTRYLCALDYYHAKRREIVIAAPSHADMAPALESLSKRYLPNSIVVLKHHGNAAEIERLVPWLDDIRIPEQGFMAYVCTGHTCAAPVSSIEELEKLFA